MTENETKAIQIVPQIPVNGLDAYLLRVNEIPMLTREEEVSLSTKYHEEGDLAAAQKLVLSHLRYVVKVSKGYMGYGLPLADLIQEGTVGLMKAVKGYNPKLGVRLVSFAVHWIKAEIHEYVLRNWRIVKVATTKAQRKLFFNLRSAKKRLGWSTQEEVETIASDLGVSPVEVRRMEQRLNARDVQFDLPKDDDQNDNHALVPAEYLEDKNSDPEIQLEHENWDQSTQARFKLAFARLDLRSQNILEKRWLTEHKATLEELSEIHQVSKERIRQLEKSAIEKLKLLLLEDAA